MSNEELIKILKDGRHHCDYGCDNNCEMDGMLYSYIVEDLLGLLKQEK